MKALPHSLNTYNFFSILICKCPVKSDMWEIFYVSDQRCGYKGLKYRTVFVLMVLSYSSLMFRNEECGEITVHFLFIWIPYIGGTLAEPMSVPTGNTLFLDFLNLSLVYLYTERRDLTHESFILCPYLCINSRGCVCRSMFFSDTQGFCLNRRLLTCNQ